MTTPGPCERVELIDEPEQLSLSGTHRPRRRAPTRTPLAQYVAEHNITEKDARSMNDEWDRRALVQVQPTAATTAASRSRSAAMR